MNSHIRCFKLSVARVHTHIGASSSVGENVVNLIVDIFVLYGRTLNVIMLMCFHIMSWHSVLEKLPALCIHQFT